MLAASHAAITLVMYAFSPLLLLDHVVELEVWRITQHALQALSLLGGLVCKLTANCSIGAPALFQGSSLTPNRTEQSGTE